MAQNLGGKAGGPAVEDGLAKLAHQVEEEVHVVGGQQDVAQDFIGPDQVAEVGATEIMAGVAAAGGVQRGGVTGVLGIVQVEPAAQEHGCAVAGQPGGQDAVEDVYAAQDSVDQVFGRADAHQVAGFAGRQDGVENVQGGEHVGLALADG